MIVVCAVTIVLYLLLYLKSRRIKCSGENKKGIMLVFYKMGLFLLSVVSEKAFSKRKVSERLSLLYPIYEKNTLRKHYYAQKLSMVLMLVLVGVIFIFALWLSEQTGSILRDGYLLERGDYGESERDITLRIATEGEEKDFAYQIASRKYSRSQVKAQMKTFEEHLEDYILGENTSLEEVDSPLLLQSGYEDFVFAVEWESEDYTVVDSDGSVLNDALTAPVCVMLTAQMSYDTVVASCSFPVQVVPVKKTKEELFDRALSDAIQTADEAQKTEKVFALPEKIDGQKVTYSMGDQKQYAGYFVALLGIAAALYAAKDRDLEKKAEQRQRELFLMYPEFVSQFVLLTGAGMTVRNVLMRLSGEQTLGDYLRQELLLLVRDLGNGVLETEALDRFGKRCGITPYIKFSGLLIQNMKKGNDTLLALLQQEAQDAFTKRKNDARKLGEEAGTKLLLPMMGMLVVVVIVLVVPAFLSFRV